MEGGYLENVFPDESMSTWPKFCKVAYLHKVIFVSPELPVVQLNNTDVF